MMLLGMTVITACPIFAQSKEAKISGNFQSDAQIYYEDTLIGAQDVPEKMLLNGFANINFTKGNFRAGVRYENYTNPLLGFPPGYKGSGLVYKYAGYEYKGLDVTVGNFYEQFGSGLILRSYEERLLGLDNAFEGIRLKYSPAKGVYLKALYGNQRMFFTTGEGVVRGIDGEFVVNELLNDSTYKKGTLILGGSFVSKYQEDKDPLLVYPENVASYAARLQYTVGGFNLNTEYVHKYNDPSKDNQNIYQVGRAIMINAGYSQKGLGITAGLKSINNMSFRSDRSQDLTNLFINYIPASNKQHTYNLAATLYPYATQPLGEYAVSGEVFYKVPKGSLLGGKYGMDVSVNVSATYAPTKKPLDPTTDSLRLGFESSGAELFKPGKEVYYKDINFAIKKKINKKLKMKLTYINLTYNESKTLGLAGEREEFKVKGLLNAHIGVADVTYKLNKRNSIRVEAQHLSTEKHRGNWATGVLEYTFSPHWFVGIIDQYNYGNSVDNQKIHYFYSSVGYINKGNRFTLGYGRQRAGVFCVGGVCRQVPASNGISLSVSSSF